jgi:hybrid cluster-associated redox disulfide protein
MKSNTPNKKPIKEKATKDSNLGELVFMYPKTAEILLDWGLHCVGCGAMYYDTLEAGAKIHGLSDKEIEELLVRINEVIEFGE